MTVASAGSVRAGEPMGLRADAAPTSVPAGVRTTFVHHADDDYGVLYEPTKPEDRATIGIVVTHYGDYTRFIACPELARRGYRVLCESPSSGNLDKTIAETGLAVDFLKRLAGVRKVVLLGHSGGATIVSAYQAMAESGLGFCQNARMVHACPSDLAGLTPADGVILPDANWGDAEMTLFSIDPAVVDESDGTAIDEDLDMYSAKNGFSPGGSQYSESFRRKFLAAEAARYNRLVAAAQAKVARLDAGTAAFTGDAPMVISGGSSLGPNNKLFSQDTGLLSTSSKPYPLLHKGGAQTSEVIHSLRVAQGHGIPAANFRMGTMNTTVRDFLSGFAIRVAPDFYYDATSIHGIDWDSSYANPPGNVGHIHVPLIAMGMTGHWEGLAAETIYEHATSADKQIAFVEGASHMYVPCTECERTPDEFGDTVKTLFDYLDGWLSKPGRFLPTR
ncbi:hypothetical protein [Novosphingobium sp. 9]|uniref:hypothetical protein n=1 Tax=Novosphingobium sp. 9 TaxID=2025349 RepID=UPI0021B5A6DF|nr:hypothetical protein [Novosphingobium sp. 9]